MIELIMPRRQHLIKKGTHKVPKEQLYLGTFTVYEMVQNLPYRNKNLFHWG